MIDRLDRWIAGFLAEGASFVTFSEFVDTL